jgi:preprotein translocase subunit SecE
VAEKSKSIQVKEPNRFQKWFRETIGELRKVNWPTWQEALRMTKMVLFVLVGMSVILGLLDWVFSRLVALIVS